MDGVYMGMLPVNPLKNMLSQTIGNMGNISEVTPKTIRISWQVTSRECSRRALSCCLPSKLLIRGKKNER